MTREQFLGSLFALCCCYVGICIFISLDLNASSRVAFRLLGLCTVLCILFYFVAFPVTSKWIDS
ncbi:UNVERIFIED_CONTAM: hypothetical protein NCL1_57403 [Trichonephila clavipes]